MIKNDNVILMNLHIKLGKIKGVTRDHTPF